MALKTRMHEAEAPDITPMIDIVFQLIIFFMVVMAITVVYGVAIKFPPPGRSSGKQNQKTEKNLIVFIAPDRITRAENGEHVIIQDGVMKINGEEIAFTKTPPSTENFSAVYAKWNVEREEALDKLQLRLEHLIKNEQYKSDVLMIQGDMKTYHNKVMKVIDRGKRVDTGIMIDDPNNPGSKMSKVGIDGFSLMPPQR